MRDDSSQTIARMRNILAEQTEDTPKIKEEAISEKEPEKKRAVIRTSDRIAFKACRRKWGFSSHLRGNLGPKQNASPLWMGSGFHFAMEDYYGYKHFPTPMDAFEEYVYATRAYNRESLPDNYEEDTEMAISMLKYFLLWEKRHAYSLLPTLWIEDEPQVEVNFRIKIPVSDEVLEMSGYDEVVYSGTIDRVCIDKETGLIWLLDYKTAKVFNTNHFLTDPQVTTYCWAAANLYDMPIAGMIYGQHKKLFVKSPKVLKSGNLSTAQNQSTTHILYERALKRIHGSVTAAPEANQEYLRSLLHSEESCSDKFIQYHKLPRNERMQQAEGVKILMECEDMLNPNLPLYPNPTRDCTVMCSFNGVCVSMDDGSDWEPELRDSYRLRERDYDGWRSKIRWPQDQKAPEEKFNWDKI